jgi:hypothetical protein
LHDAVVGDRGHIDADVVSGDDALRLDRRGDDPQRNPAELVEERDDHAQAGRARAVQPSQPEQHALLVLPDQAHRQCESEQNHYHDDDEDGNQCTHGIHPYT